MADSASPPIEDSMSIQESNIDESAIDEKRPLAHLAGTDVDITARNTQTPQNPDNSFVSQSFAVELDMNCGEWILSFLAVSLSLSSCILNWYFNKERKAKWSDLAEAEVIVIWCIVGAKAFSIFIYLWLTVEYYFQCHSHTYCYLCKAITIFIYSLLSCCIYVPDPVTVHTSNKFRMQSYVKAMISRRIGVVFLVEVVCIGSSIFVVQQTNIGWIYLGFSLFEILLFLLDNYRLICQLRFPQRSSSGDQTQHLHMMNVTDKRKHHISH